MKNVICIRDFAFVAGLGALVQMGCAGDPSQAGATGSGGSTTRAEGAGGLGVTASGGSGAGGESLVTPAPDAGVGLGGAPGAEGGAEAAIDAATDSRASTAGDASPEAATEGGPVEGGPDAFIPELCAMGARRCDGQVAQVCELHWSAVADCSAGGGSCLDGQCMGPCTPGTTYCGSDDVERRCTPAGAWETTPCGLGNRCSEGSCTCTFGDTPSGRRCSGDEALRCVSGRWSHLENCSAGCLGGYCEPGLCSPPAMRCNGTALEGCFLAGPWQVIVQSSSRCAPAAPLCIPGEVRCAGQSPERCDAAGIWQSSTPCGAQACVGGHCVGTCAPDTFGACSGTTASECGPEGEWRDVACTIDCTDGRGCWECSPGARDCDVRGSPRLCSDDGTWQPAGPCVDQACVDGDCVGDCAPDAFGACDGDLPRRCTATGAWETLDQSCPEACVDDLGCVACAPGERRCSSATAAQICSSTGSWLNAPCTAQACVGGECVGVCSPSSYGACTGTTASRCSASGQWEALPCATGCADGRGCTPCSPLETGCLGNTPRTCDVRGQWQAASPCVDQACVTGACVGSCTPRTADSCVSGSERICSAAGEWQTNACSGTCIDGFGCTGSCGAQGDLCCTDKPACEPDSACVTYSVTVFNPSCPPCPPTTRTERRCDPCGGGGEPCCSGSTCDGSGLACVQECAAGRTCDAFGQCSCLGGTAMRCRAQ